MVDDGDDAPDFSAPLANGDVGETFTLSERLEEEAPIVFAFFPGAFTSVCTDEMNTIDGRLDAYDAAGATVYGVSIDSPFSLNEFRDQNDIEFDFISDVNRDLVQKFGVGFDFLGVDDIAQRAVFVIAADGTIDYAWVADDPTNEPDYDELEDAAEAAA